MSSNDRPDRLILHLGHGKTGSTSIQRTLRASRQALHAAGLLFPDPGRHDNHQLLFPHLHGDLPDDPVQMASLAATPEAARTNAKGLWTALLQQIAKERPRGVILSCENQFRPLPPDALHRLTQHCAQIAQRTQVVAYLRSPAQFFLSNIQQDVKKRAEFRPISASRIRDTLGPFVDHGPGPVSARCFARDQLLGGDVVTDFAQRFLPELDADSLTRGAAEENSSVSAEAMALLQQVFRGHRDLPRAYAKDLKGFRKIIVETDKAVEGYRRPALFSEVRQIAEARVSDLEWTRDVLGVTFADVPAPGMTRAAAETAYATLRDVAQVCAVDSHRLEALWQQTLARAKTQARPFGWLFRR
ncbi:hypothetical protein [Antarctobacter sp.]|uniref:hypothetical protein n=1 Tax=Antarctobacter sp. TaxID=1872577 RepID=UPI002B2698FB|nr:hypothetical protein [Antarctobacter sp.]